MIEPGKIAKATVNIEYFNKEIFPLSFTEKIVEAPHTQKWVKDMAQNTHVAIISARKHLKSVSVYSYLMWRLLRNIEENREIFYFSYNQDVASYHTNNLKKLIQTNPYFQQVTNHTPAMGIIESSWDGKHMFTVKPQGMTSFKRGLHPHEVICLTPETKIKTKEGLKSISEIKKDEFVLTDKKEYKRVLTTYKRFIKEPIYNIELKNGNKIRITGNHRVKTTKGWVRAENLTIEDELL